MPGPRPSRLRSLVGRRTAAQPRRPTLATRAVGDVPTGAPDAALFAHTLDAVFVVGVEADDTFRFRGINPAYTALTGLTEAAMVGQTTDEVFAADVVADAARAAA